MYNLDFLDGYYDIQIMLRPNHWSLLSCLRKIPLFLHQCSLNVSSAVTSFVGASHVAENQYNRLSTRPTFPIGTPHSSSSSFRIEDPTKLWVVDVTHPGALFPKSRRDAQVSQRGG